MVLAPPVTSALAATLLAAQLAILLARRLQQLMKHTVVMIGQLVYFSALHPLQLAIDEGCETVPDGDDGRGGIKCELRLRAASF